MEEAQEQSLVEVIDPVRANQVLQEIDRLLEWKNKAEQTVEKNMMLLCLNLLEAHRNRYWKVRGFEDESQYVEATFSHSRQYYYDLIRIGQTLGHCDHKVLSEIGPTKCRDLVKIHNHFGVIPNNYFAHAMEEDRDTFHRRVKAAITEGVATTRDPREEVIVEMLSFVGSQYFDFTEALRIVQMETGIEKKTEALCMIFREFLSGYRDDGAGRLQNRNSFLMGVIQRCYEQIDRNQAHIYDRLIAQLATWVEAGRDAKPKLEGQEDQIIEA
jgi:hypothetical protein